MLKARDVVDRMALAIQAALLLQHAPAHIADAFCASRLAAGGHRNYGTLPRGEECEAIIRARHTPRLNAATRPAHLLSGAYRPQFAP